MTAIQTMSTYKYLQVLDVADTNNDGKASKEELESYQSFLEAEHPNNIYLDVTQNMVENFAIFDNRNNPHATQTTEVIDGEDGFIRASEIRALSRVDGKRSTISHEDIHPPEESDESGSIDFSSIFNADNPLMSLLLLLMTQVLGGRNLTMDNLFGNLFNDNGN